MHGLAVSHRYLMPLAARLAGHHPVHVVDLPGFGISGEPGRVLDVAEHADHLADWLAAAELPPVAVLGNSFGCQVAVDLAVSRPGVWPGPGRPDHGPVGTHGLPADAALAARHRPRYPLQLPILARDVRYAGLQRIAGTLAHALRDPIEDKLPLVRVPTLVTGAGSRSCPWPGPRRPAGSFRRVSWPWSRAPTMPTMGAADHLAELVLAFLGRWILTQDGQVG